MLNNQELLDEQGRWILLRDPTHSWLQSGIFGLRKCQCSERYQCGYEIKEGTSLQEKL